MTIFRRKQIAIQRFNEAMRNIEISINEVKLVSRIGAGTSGEVFHGIYRGIVKQT